MSDLIDRLKLVAAWHKRGGPTPKEKCPPIYEAISEAIAELERQPKPVEAIRVNADGSAWER